MLPFASYRGIDLVTQVSGDLHDEFVQTDDNSGADSDDNLAYAQSWQSGSDPQEVTGVVVRVKGPGVAVPGVVRAAIYAHSGTYGTSSVPTGDPLVTSAWYATDQIGSAANYFFAMSGWTPSASTNYTVAIEWDVLTDDSSKLVAIYEVGAEATHSGNGSRLQLTSVWGAESSDMAFKVYYASSGGGGGGPGTSGYERPHRRQRRGWGFGFAALLVLVLCGCDSIFGLTVSDPRVDDPCYAMTIWVDTLTLEVDSTTYEWTPGECD